MQRALLLTPLLLDETYYTVYSLAAIIYDLSKRGTDNEESTKESLPTTPGLAAKESNKELAINPLLESEILLRVRNACENNNIY